MAVAQIGVIKHCDDRFTKLSTVKTVLQNGKVQNFVLVWGQSTDQGLNSTFPLVHVLLSSFVCLSVECLFLCFCSMGCREVCSVRFLSRVVGTYEAYMYIRITANAVL